MERHTVTAEYSGTVSRIALNKTRYVAIFEGVALEPVVEEEPADAVPEVIDNAASSFNWTALLLPLGLVAAAGGGIGVALMVKRRREADDGGDGDE